MGSWKIGISDTKLQSEHACSTNGGRKEGRKESKAREMQ
jgi:hypothetical protein